MEDKKIEQFYLKVLNFISNNEFKKLVAEIFYQFSTEDYFYIEPKILKVLKQNGEKLVISLDDDLLNIKYSNKLKTEEIIVNENIEIIKTFCLTKDYIIYDRYVYDLNGKQKIQDTWQCVYNKNKIVRKEETLKIFGKDNSYAYICSNEKTDFYKNLYIPIKLKEINQKHNNYTNGIGEKIDYSEFMKHLKKLDYNKNQYIKK